jgi:ketosteroid isomerase-like protein
VTVSGYGRPIVPPPGSEAAPAPLPDPGAAVLAANQAFYDAFEARDLDAMSDLWEHSDRSVCIHPGWPALRGWGPIVASFAAMFRGGQSLQFLLTDATVSVEGSVGWVTVDENLLGEQGGNTVAAVNVFALTERGWRLVVHHGSSVYGTLV